MTAAEPQARERGWLERPGIGRVLRRELWRIRQRPLYPLLLVGLPLVGWALLAATFAYRTPRELPVAVVDADGSQLSRTLVRWIDAAPSMRVRAMPATAAAGEALLLQGEAYAVVVLPAGLERDAKRGAATPVTALYNAEWVMPGSIISRDLRRVVGTASAGLELRTRRLGGQGGAQARAALEPVQAEARALFNPELDYAGFLLPALIPTLLSIFVLVVAVQALGGELKHGTAAEWLSAAGGSAWRAVAGKLLPHALIHWLLLGALYAATYQLYGLRVRGSLPLLVLGALLLVLAYQAAAVFLIGWTANLRLSTSLSAFYSGPAFAFTGITFPLFSMPLAARIWAYLLPLTHFLRLVIDQGRVGAPLRVSLPALAALAGFVLVLPALSLWRYRALLGEPRYWGRL